LLATDGSRYARAAARFLARFVPGEGRHADVLTVIPNEPRSKRRTYGHAREMSAQWRGAALTRLDATAATLEGCGYAVRKMTRVGDPVREVVAQCGEEAYDLIVAGAKGRGASPFFPPGSVALAILEKTRGNALLVRERTSHHRKHQMPEVVRPLRVLLATDGEPHSEAAIDGFMHLVREPRLAIAVASVLEEAEELAAVRVPNPRSAATLEHAAHVHVNNAVNRLAPLDAVITPVILHGRVAPALVTQAADSDTDLIVVGSSGSRRPEESVALEIARSASCSILVVRAG
jgi:nucleotide-binding universal stress UspA family protein